MQELGCPYPWIPDQRDGTYRNPILCADYSDPDVTRVGDDYYLTASSFNCTPGLPILHSRDLVNWSIIAHAIDHVPGDQYKQPQHGCGVWAPAIRHQDGKFWIFFPTPDEGIYVITADDPRGPWSEPHLMLAAKGLIDPCPLWDDGGRAYLVHAYARSRSGIKHRLRVCPMAPDGSKILDEGKIVYDNADLHRTLEGPKFHKRNGWYYISAPAGGVATGWQVIFRSRDVYGPYENKVVLAQRATPINGPHQGALVDTFDGSEWWFVHFQEHQPYGRIVHLQPVTWKDDWPLIGVNQDEKGVGAPVLRYRKPRVRDREAQPIAVPVTSDEFDSRSPGLQWQWHANVDRAWSSLADRPGWLRLAAHHVDGGELEKAPNLLLQKLPAESFTFEAKLDWSFLPQDSRAGIVVMGKSHAPLVVQHDDQGTRLALLIDNQSVAAEPSPAGVLRLRVTIRAGGACKFAHAAETGDFHTIDREFQAVEGHWIGAKVGLFCLSACAKPVIGHADFDYARFGAP
jgi:beta-xylosidase